MQVSTAKALVEGAVARVQQHPFVVDAEAGSLTRQQALRWIFCAGRESNTFPEVLRGIVDRSRSRKVRAVLERNLDDELGKGDPSDAHFLHYLHLLDALGVPREQFANYGECAGVKLAVSLAYAVSHSDREACVLGYMMVNEALTPVTYRAAQRAINQYYPAVQSCFFDLHIEVDAHHLNDLLATVTEFSDEAVDDLRFGVSLGERGMAVILDEAYGVLDALPAKGRCAEPMERNVLE